MSPTVNMSLFGQDELVLAARPVLELRLVETLAVDAD
jgi:hypothetical protein